MQKRVFLEADIHKRRLKVVFQILDASFEDTAHKALFFGMLDHELLKPSVFQDRDARFQPFHVYYDFTFHL